MVQLWYCPRCDAEARTVTTRLPHHPCPGMAGLMVPLIVRGDRARLLTVDREDYIGKQDVQLDDNGRPVMAVEVEHADGSTDRTVYAPTATVNTRD